jgi:hypothetical protein
MEIVRGLEGGIGDVARKRDDIIDACVEVSDLIGGAVVHVGVNFGTPAAEVEALRE